MYTVRPQIISLLLERGANIQQLGFGNSTLLYILVYSFRRADTPMDFEACVHLLTQHGLKWNTLNRNRNTPFGLAIRRRFPVETLRLMIRCGADVNQVGHQDETALHLLFRREVTRDIDVPHVLEIAHFLLNEQGISIQQLNEVGGNVLFRVSRKERNVPQIMTFLIESGIDINLISQSGKTAFQQAAHKKQFIQAVVNSGRLFEFNHHLCGELFKSSLLRMKCIVFMLWMMHSPYYSGRTILCTDMFRHLCTFL